MLAEGHDQKAHAEVYDWQANPPFSLTHLIALLILYLEPRLSFEYLIRNWNLGMFWKNIEI